ncbi:hypothetical protein E4T56_gene8177 [Termitomyces sp. T112]|nr:hypothetical protein E4T56_gene8177 [Termitomyces sp. T112]
MLLPTPAQRSSTPLLTAWKTVEQHISAKEKGKGKAKEPEPLTAADEQLAHLLQWLHKAGVPEDVSADILNNSVVQDEVHADLFHSALGKGKHVATPPNPPEAKKAHMKPSVFVEESSTQRAPLMPYDDMVPAGDDQRMNKHPDFKATSSFARPSKPVVAQVKLPKLAATKEGTSKPSTKRAGTGQLAATVIEADNSMVIAFPANVPQGAEAGVIEVLKLRTYIMPGVLPQEYRPPVHQDLHDKEFYVTQQAAVQAMAGVSAASDLDSNDDDDDDVPTSK